MPDTDPPIDPRPALTDRLLHLALLAPHGRAKSSLAHAASLLSGYHDPLAMPDGLRDQVRTIWLEIAELWLKNPEAFSAGVIDALETALRALTPTAPPSGASQPHRPAPSEATQPVLTE